MKKKREKRKEEKELSEKAYILEAYILGKNHFRFRLLNRKGKVLLKALMVEKALRNVAHLKPLIFQNEAFLLSAPPFL